MFKVQLHAHFKAPVQTRINVAEIFIFIIHKTFFCRGHRVVLFNWETKQKNFGSSQRNSILFHNFLLP